MKRSIGLAAAATTLAMVALPLGVVSTGSSPALAAGFSYKTLTPLQKRLLSGGSAMALQGAGASTLRANSSTKPSYFPQSDDGCTARISFNIKVNTNCLNISDPDLAGRGQANNETSIAYDPRNPRVMVASANDYRTGDGNCYTHYSRDGGRNWQDSTPPTSFTRGQVDNVVDFGAARQYWGGGGDTSVAFDTKGNAYLSCQLFNRGEPVSNNPDISSALVVYRSTKNGGASWNFPGRYVRASADVTASGVPPFLDKQLMTVDNHVGSPYQDRVYVSWTEFASDGSAFIYEAHSSDYGEHFTPPKLVSTTSPLCVQTYGAGTVATTGQHSNCNENQFSQPFTGPDGNLYIVYANFNNAVSAGLPEDPDEDRGDGGDADAGAAAAAAAPADNRNQMLLSKSVDGGNTFSPPVKVSDYYDLPDCATYQAGKDPGRSCVPEKGTSTNSYFRAVNYPSGAVDPTNSKKVVVTFGSYINRHSNEANGCVPTGFSSFGTNVYTGVKTPGACNNDILISVSTNKGGTFTGTTKDPRVLQTVTTDRRQATTDQWWQWTDFTRTGKLATSYYDRQYGSDEMTGYSDVSLSGSKDLRHFGVKRVTSSSMPPPTQFEGVFYGDYTGLAAPSNAYPLWSDTRTPALFVCPGTATAGTPPRLCTASASNAKVANDQELRTAIVSVPSK
ncbi:exo-alpha-sialidase [Jatrophihabitans sp.]|uniref:exo-alpha-sialidase n=1 Tax=Jatrophihabitans sp. TaxID=1932789 RepID=UPI002EFD8628